MKKVDIQVNPDNKEQLIATTTGDASILLDAVAEIRNTYDPAKLPDKDMRPLMYITGDIINHWCVTNKITWEIFHGPDHKKYLKQLINDPDMAYFRVAPGKY